MRPGSRTPQTTRDGGPGSAPAQAAVPGEDDGLGASLHAKLVEDVRDVIAESLFRKAQAGGDLRVVDAPCDMVQDLRFPPRKLAEAPRRSRSRRNKGPQLLEEAPECRLRREEHMVL